MIARKKQITTINEYIKSFPAPVSGILGKMRQVIKETAPGAAETISYRIPAFVLNGALVYFAAFKNHIGFFPTSSGVSKFKKELSRYSLSKGTVRFPMDEPIPYDLVKKITAFRVQENLKRKK
jgi:uncharacterized protein YdhG (YjbR/CyaY superfamily)